MYLLAALAPLLCDMDKSPYDLLLDCCGRFLTHNTHGEYKKKS